MRKSKMDNPVNILWKLVIMSCISAASANLEGPFLFWGPKSLEDFRRPALQSLEQDDLIKIYDKQAAIVVFNNQDSVPLSGDNFPRLRKLLERQSLLVLPQDFLDVHPDYISNETQVFTLQGPNSERDAEITETFDRLEDIYGSGRVLGVLGNSMSQDYVDRTAPCAYGEDEEQRRRRRDAAEPPRRRRRPDDTDEDEDAATTREPRAEKTTERALPEYALYNASGSSGKALIYSSSWPVLRYDSGEEIQLKRPLTATVSTAKVGGKQFTKLVITYSHENNKISIQFRFTSGAGWWCGGGAEVSHLARDSSVLLQAPPAPGAPTAPLGWSYHCSQPLVYVGHNASLTFSDIQMQPFMESTDQFSDSFDCVGFTSVPIWSGVALALLLTAVLFVSISLILDIKTMDRFENNKGKCLTITVSE